VKEIFRSIKFHQYLEDPVSGQCKSIDTINYVLLVNARFLLWTHIHIHHRPLVVTVTNVLEWTYDIVVNHSSVLFEYQNYVLTTQKFSPDTIVSIVWRLKEYIEWFYAFRQAEEFKLDFNLYNKFTIICHKVLKGARKVRARRRRSKSGAAINSLDDAIADRRLPQGGLKELQDAVMTEMDWVRSFCTLYRRGAITVTEEVYQRLVCVMMASIYVFAPQGRVSGIHDMQLKDAEKLLTTFATSKDFKTSDKYVLQAVSLGDISKEIVSIYLKYFRIHACTPRPFPTDPLFITFQGAPDTRLGRHVHTFFKNQLQLNTSTTLIRALVETTVDARYRAGEISLDQREAVSAISGHSSRIVQDHYVRVNIADQLRKAKEALGMREDNLSIDSPGLVAYKDWGTAHPQYHVVSGNARIKFSDEEDAYLLELVQDHLQVDNSLPNRFCALALQRIKADPHAIPIFHKRHIFSTDRLRARLRHFQLRK
jgi:hypothetical protein